MSDEPKHSPPADPVEDSGKHDQRSRRFRFKSKREDDTHSNDDVRSHKRRTDEAHPPRRSKRRKSSRSRDDSHAQHHSSNHLSSEQAFRESLFDALGDDEGASFWEGVYGQPIHQYADTYEDVETGELEQMTEDEYAQFVRRKMWEKSWEGIEAAKEEKRRERQEEKRRIRDEETRRQGATRARHDDDVFDTQIEASLRRGGERKERRRWQQLWHDYLRRWEELQALARDRQRAEDDAEQVFLRNKIAWPVESGKRKDVVRDEIERFLRKGTATSEAAGDSFANAIKNERVRWHPDKIQQRFGFMEIDESTLKGVTAVFQVFDAIWNEIRGQAT